MSATPLKNSGNLAFGPFQLNRASRILVRNGAPVPVAPKVLDTLIVLLESRGRVMTKEELLDALWPDTTVEERNLTQNVSTLRKILGDNPKDPQYVATIAGRGYSFIATVSELPAGLVPIPPRYHGRSAWLWLALAAIAVLITSVPYILHHRRIALPDERILPLTAEPGVETMPAFSPDGKQITYVRSDFDPQPWRGFWEQFFGPTSIYVKVIDSGAESQLTKAVASDSFPAWSPDGRSIAFARRTSTGECGYYVVSAFGGPERRISAASGYSGGVAWSPDGKRLVVAEVSHSPQSSPLMAISVDTGARRPLTAPAHGMDLFPTFSPDGKWLAFVRTLDYNSSDVLVVPANGGPARSITSDHQAYKHSIAWTDDSQEILYSALSLWRIPVRGGTPHLVGAGAQFVGKIDVAPRGHRLAYVSHAPSQSLWRVDLNPSEPTRAPAPTEFAPATRDQTDAQFSPDGRRIAFLSGRSGAYEIWTADANGEDLKRLTDLQHTGSPAWSPDGRQIAFDARLNGNPDIWAIHADGGAPWRVTNNPAEDVVPSWSQDGKSIYFASDRGGEFQVWKAAATGESAQHPAAQVTNSGAFRALETSDGKFVYFVKGRETPGLWRRGTAGANGPEEQLIPTVHTWGWWTLAPQGVLFFEQHGPVASLLLYRFSDRRTRKLADLSTRVDEHALSISVSQDERHIVYTQHNPDNADIILIENFR